MPMLIDGREISSDIHPFIIAEMSGNHLRSLDTAARIIKAAVEAEADAIKIQLFDPTRLATARGGAIRCCNPEFGKAGRLATSTNPRVPR